MTDNYAIQELGVALTKLERRLVTGLDQVNRRISALESQIGGRFDDGETHARKRNIELGTRIEAAAAQQKRIGYLLDGLEDRLAKRVDGLDVEVRRQLAKLQAKVDDIGSHFAGSS